MWLKLKTPKLLNIPNKGVTNLRNESSKTTKTLRKQTENTRKMSTSVNQCRG